MTAIVSDCGISQAFIASFADGVVKVFCRRLGEEDAVVRITQHGSRTFVGILKLSRRFYLQGKLNVIRDT